MSFADLESAIALSNKGLLSPNSFKNVVRRVVQSRGATAGSAKEVRVCSQMFHRLTPRAKEGCQFLISQVDGRVNSLQSTSLSVIVHCTGSSKHES